MDGFIRLTRSSRPTSRPNKQITGMLPVIVLSIWNAAEWVYYTAFVGHISFTLTADEQRNDRWYKRWDYALQPSKIEEVKHSTPECIVGHLSAAFQSVPCLAALDVVQCTRHPQLTAAYWFVHPVSSNIKSLFRSISCTSSNTRNLLIMSTIWHLSSQPSVSVFCVKYDLFS